MSHLNRNHKKEEIKHKRSWGSGGYFNSEQKRWALGSILCQLKETGTHETALAPSPLPWEGELRGPPAPAAPALPASPFCTERGDLGSFSPTDRLSHVFLILPKLPSVRELEPQGSLGQASSLPSAFLSKTRYISQGLLNHACKHQLGLTESMGLVAVAYCLGL